MMINRLMMATLSLLVPFCASNTLWSPILDLEASVAASVAHGTTVAVCINECVVVLTRTATSKASSMVAAEEQEASFEKFGLKLFDLPSASSRHVVLGSGCFCLMTGFSPDVGHLQKVLLKSVESHRAFYSEDKSNRKTAKDLSNYLQQASLHIGARPFGVQALLIGLDDANRWSLSTCDPTGSTRHYRDRATCIGRHAAAVRQHVGRNLDSLEDVQSAISLAKKAIKAALDEAGETDKDHGFQGILLWQETYEQQQISAAQIDPEILAASEQG